MVSTGATMRSRMLLIVSYASFHRAGAGCGTARACGIGLAFFGDALFALRGLGVVISVFTTTVELSADPEPVALDSGIEGISSCLTLARFERRTGGSAVEGSWTS